MIHYDTRFLSSIPSHNFLSQKRPKDWPLIHWSSWLRLVEEIKFGRAVLLSTVDGGVDLEDGSCHILCAVFLILWEGTRPYVFFCTLLPFRSSHRMESLSKTLITEISPQPCGFYLFLNMAVVVLIVAWSPTTAEEIESLELSICHCILWLGGSQENNFCRGREHLDAKAVLRRASWSHLKQVKTFTHLETKWQRWSHGRFTVVHYFEGRCRLHWQMDFSVFLLSYSFAFVPLAFFAFLNSRLRCVSLTLSSFIICHLSLCYRGIPWVVLMPQVALVILRVIMFHHSSLGCWYCKYRYQNRWRWRRCWWRRRSWSWS